jgi:hypothetical protein
MGVIYAVKGINTTYAFYGINAQYAFLGIPDDHARTAVLPWATCVKWLRVMAVTSIPVHAELTRQAPRSLVAVIDGDALAFEGAGWTGCRASDNAPTATEPREKRSTAMSDESSIRDLFDRWE